VEIEAVMSQYRQVLGQYPTGVVVITAMGPDGEALAMTVGTFSSVSLDPPLVSFMPQNTSSSWAALRASGSKFCANLLSGDQEDICRQVAMRKTEKLEGIEWYPSEAGNPIIKNSVAFVDCDTTVIHEAGDHDIVIGRVVDLGVLTSDDPLLFFRGGYGSFISKSLIAWDADLTDQLRQVDLGRPYMEQLAQEFTTEVTAICLVRDELVLASAAGRAETAQAPTRVGQRVPFMPPLGGVFAAWADEATQEKWLSRAGHDLSDADKTKLAATISRIRDQGYSLGLGHSAGERLEATSTRANLGDPAVTGDVLQTLIREVADSYNPEILHPDELHELRSITAPVFGENGKVAYSMTLWGPKEPVSVDTINRLARQLRTTCDSASAAIAHMQPVISTS